jgi:hypothetical protein
MKELILAFCSVIDVGQATARGRQEECKEDEKKKRLPRVSYKRTSGAPKYAKENPLGNGPQ